MQPTWRSSWRWGRRREPVTIINELKKVHQVLGVASEIMHNLGIPRKNLLEGINVGLPVWDPPPELPPGPPDEALVARVQEAQGMAANEERRAFEKVLGTYRKISQGEPRQPAQVPGRRQEPVQPAQRKEVPR